MKLSIKNREFSHVFMSTFTTGHWVDPSTSNPRFLKIVQPLGGISASQDAMWAGEVTLRYLGEMRLKLSKMMGYGRSI